MTELDIYDRLQAVEKERDALAASLAQSIRNTRRTLDEIEALRREGKALVDALDEWGNARSAFLDLPPGSDNVRPYLNRLSEAEYSLMAAFRKRIEGEEPKAPPRSPNDECETCGGEGIDGDPYGLFDFSVSKPCPGCWPEKDQSNER